MDYRQAFAIPHPQRFYVLKDKLASEPTIEMCLVAVRHYGCLLNYVPAEQWTHEVCLVAVKNNAYALEYVIEQTRDICLIAVKRIPQLLSLVNEPTDEIRHAAATGRPPWLC